MLSPAAFRRLCVETCGRLPSARKTRPAAFRRLCVETEAPQGTAELIIAQPPSGGCVLKRSRAVKWAHDRASRLQAAVC